MGFPGGSAGKESTCSTGDLGSIPGTRRSPGKGNGYPLQYSGLENSMDRGAWKSEFPGGSDGKESACSSRELSSIPGSGRSPGKGNGYPLQYFCLENSMGRGTWQATVHVVTKSDTTEQLTHLYT